MHRTISTHTRRVRPRRTRALLLAASVCGAVLLAACGSNPSSTPSATESDTAAADTGATAVEAAFPGNYGEPPTAGPPVATGKKVYVLAAFQQISGIAHLSEEAQAAADAIGWESVVCDGKNNDGGAWAGCVRQAVADNADAIILESIDCAPVKQALVEARAAGIKIASVTAFDCSDPTQGGSEPLIDAPIAYVDGVDGIADYYRQQGRLRADWVIAQSGGSAKVLHVAFEGVAFGEYLSAGFEEGMETCGGCEIVSTLSITPADIPQIRQKFDTALLQATSADSVAVDVDFMFAAGIQQSLATSGRTGLHVAGGECAIESLDYLRVGGGQQMCIGSSLGYMSWAAIDGLNRVFNGEDVAASGVGWQLVDAENNLPEEGEHYDGPVDYRTLYEKLWSTS